MFSLFKNISLVFLPLIFLIVRFVNPAFSQCEQKNTAFSENEKLEYSVFYNLSFIWVEAGEVAFHTKLATLGDKKVYRLTGYGRSLSNYDWIYKVRDKYESYIDINTLKPYKFEQNTTEGDYYSKQSYLFDYQKSLIYTEKESTKQLKMRDTFRIKTCIHDLMSSMYYARNMDFSTFKINQKIPFTAIIDNEIVTLYGRYLGKETVTLKNGIRYKCSKFAALVLSGSIFSGGEDLVVWVSDDANKIPVAVETKIRVGSVKVHLTKAEGLKNEQKSLLK